MSDIVKVARDELAFARISLHEAEHVVAISPRIAAREAYSAMFHGAQARIAADGRPVPKSHKGVSVVLGEI